MVGSTGTSEHLTARKFVRVAMDSSPMSQKIFAVEWIDGRTDMVEADYVGVAGMPGNKFPLVVLARRDGDSDPVITHVINPMAGLKFIRTVDMTVELGDENIPR
jgi:hypothetical protein